MLRQIKKALDETSAEESPIVTVWFNPWQFVAEEHLIIPFFHTLIAALESAVQKSAKDKVALSQKLSGFVKKIAHVPLALLYGTELELFFLKLHSDKTIDYLKKKGDGINAEIERENETAVQVMPTGNCGK